MNVNITQPSMIKNPKIIVSGLMSINKTKPSNANGMTIS